MIGIKREKKELRIKIYNLQKCLTKIEEEEESAQIIKEIEESDYFKKAKWIMAYWPMSHEVDLRSLLKKWNKKNWVLPSIENGKLVLKRFEQESALIVSKHFGILEPKGEALLIHEKIELVIVPGVAFDQNRRRLGHGKAYYDTLLPKLQNAFTVGVGFSYQRVPSVPCEAHDYLLDAIITAKRCS